MRFERILTSPAAGSGIGSQAQRIRPPAGRVNPGLEKREGGADRIADARGSGGKSPDRTEPETHMTSRTLALASALLAGSFGAASASDADFTLRNRTGYQIDEVYVSPASAAAWGSDIMGSSAVPDGASVSVTFPHGGAACRFDIKVKYSDGDTAEWGGVDLCKYEAISLFWDARAKTTRAVGE